MSIIDTLEFDLNSKRFVNKLEAANREMKLTEYAARRMGRTVSNSLMYIGAGFAGYQLRAITMDLLSAASTAQETHGKFRAVFKHLTTDATNAAKELHQSFNFSMQEAEEGLANMANTFYKAGLSLSQALDYANNLTKRASDIQAFQNLDEVTQVTDAMVAGMNGMGQRLRNLGVMLYQADVKTEMLRQAQMGYVFANQKAAKMAATYSIIMRQSATSAGQVAREHGNLANRTRALESSLKNIKATVGSALIGPATVVVEKMNQVAKAVDNLGDRTKSVIGLGLLGAGLAAVITMTAKFIAEWKAFNASVRTPEAIEEVREAVTATATSTGASTKMMQEQIATLQAQASSYAKASQTIVINTESIANNLAMTNGDSQAKLNQLQLIMANAQAIANENAMITFSARAYDSALQVIASTIRARMLEEKTRLSNMRSMANETKLIANQTVSYVRLTQAIAGSNAARRRGGAGAIASASKAAGLALSSPMASAKATSANSYATYGKELAIQKANAPKEAAIDADLTKLEVESTNGLTRALDGMSGMLTILANPLTFAAMSLKNLANLGGVSGPGTVIVNESEASNVVDLESDVNQKQKQKDTSGGGKSKKPLREPSAFDKLLEEEEAKRKADFVTPVSTPLDEVRAKEAGIQSAIANDLKDNTSRASAMESNLLINRNGITNELESWQGRHKKEFAKDVARGRGLTDAKKLESMFSPKQLLLHPLKSAKRLTTRGNEGFADELNHMRGYAGLPKGGKLGGVLTKELHMPKIPLGPLGKIPAVLSKVMGKFKPFIDLVSKFGSKIGFAMNYFRPIIGVVAKIGMKFLGLGAVIVGVLELFKNLPKMIDFWQDKIKPALETAANWIWAKVKEYGPKIWNYLINLPKEAALGVGDSVMRMFGVDTAHAQAHRMEKAEEKLNAAREDAIKANKQYEDSLRSISDFEKQEQFRKAQSLNAVGDAIGGKLAEWLNASEEMATAKNELVGTEGRNEEETNQRYNELSADDKNKMSTVEMQKRYGLINTQKHLEERIATEDKLNTYATRGAVNAESFNTQLAGLKQDKSLPRKLLETLSSNMQEGSEEKKYIDYVLKHSKDGDLDKLDESTFANGDEYYKAKDQWMTKRVIVNDMLGRDVSEDLQDLSIDDVAVQLTDKDKKKVGTPTALQKIQDLVTRGQLTEDERKDFANTKNDYSKILAGNKAQAESELKQLQVEQSSAQGEEQKAQIDKKVADKQKEVNTLTTTLNDLDKMTAANFPEFVKKFKQTGELEASLESNAAQTIRNKDYSDLQTVRQQREEAVQTYNEKRAETAKQEIEQRQNLFANANAATDRQLDAVNKNADVRNQQLQLQQARSFTKADELTNVNTQISNIKAKSLEQAQTLGIAVTDANGELDTKATSENAKRYTEEALQARNSASEKRTLMENETFYKMRDLTSRDPATLNAYISKKDENGNWQLDVESLKQAGQSDEQIAKLQSTYAQDRANFEAAKASMKKAGITSVKNEAGEDVAVDDVSFDTAGVSMLKGQLKTTYGDIVETENEANERYNRNTQFLQQTMQNEVEIAEAEKQRIDQEREMRMDVANLEFEYSQRDLERSQHVLDRQKEIRGRLTEYNSNLLSAVTMRGGNGQGVDWTKTLGKYGEYVNNVQEQVLEFQRNNWGQSYDLMNLKVKKASTEAKLQLDKEQTSKEYEYYLQRQQAADQKLYGANGLEQRKREGKLNNEEEAEYERQKQISNESFDKAREKYEELQNLDLEYQDQMLAIDNESYQKRLELAGEMTQPWVDKMRSGFDALKEENKENLRGVGATSAIKRGTSEAFQMAAKVYDGGNGRSVEQNVHKIEKYCKNVQDSLNRYLADNASDIELSLY